MPVCQTCGLEFFPQTSAWGDETCGHCLADQIESMLSGGLVGRQRRPMRRASSSLDELDNPVMPLPERKVIGG